MAHTVHPNASITSRVIKAGDPPPEDDEFYEIHAPIVGHHEHHSLLIGPGPTSCGKIFDGTTLRFNDEAGWVIPFTDLERAYQWGLRNRMLLTWVTKIEPGEYNRRTREAGLQGKSL